MRAIAGEAAGALGKVSYAVDEALSAIVDGFPKVKKGALPLAIAIVMRYRHEVLTIVDGFPKVIDSTRGEQLLGMQPCADVSTLIREYMADFPAALVAELQVVGAEVSARL